MIAVANISTTLQRVRRSIGGWLTGVPNYSTAVLDEIRVREATYWLIREYTPTWLTAAGLHDEVRQMRTADVTVEVAQKIRAAAVRDATELVAATDLHGTATGVAVQTAAQQAIDATPVERAVEAVWADVTERDSIVWDVWEHLAEAVYAAATAVAVRAAAENPANPEQAATEALAEVVAKLRRSARPLVELLAWKAVAA